MEYGENEGVAMKIVTYLNSLNEIDSLDRLDEIIISPSELTRYGQFSIGDISKLNTNKKLVLEWDILMTEQVFLEKVELLKKIICKSCLNAEEYRKFIEFLRQYSFKSLDVNQSSVASTIIEH